MKSLVHGKIFAQMFTATFGFTYKTKQGYNLCPSAGEMDKQIVVAPFNGTMDVFTVLTVVIPVYALASVMSNSLRPHGL